MALQGATVVLTLCLWGWLAAGPGLSDEIEDTTQMGAPPHLLALIPEAAKATVAAGYTDSNSNETQTTTGPPPLVAVSVTIGAETSPEKETVLVVGDTRYAWKEWSPWHCNCAAGSMSRVRDITYSQSGVHLDPAQYDILRFEREVCNYQACQCQQGQCNLSAVACGQGPMHMCALQDINQDKEHKRKDFWTQVHNGLRDLWKSIKDTFPPQQIGRQRGGAVSFQQTYMFEPEGEAQTVKAKQLRQSLSIALSRAFEETWDLALCSSTQKQTPLICQNCFRIGNKASLEDGQGEGGCARD